MNIGKTENASASFIKPDWMLQKEQNKDAIQSTSITKEAVDALTGKSGNEADNNFAAAYGVEISDEGYAVLA